MLWGYAGVRIWNCLIEHKQIESMTVHRRVLVPHKETCELLYRLLRAGFTASQVRGRNLLLSFLTAVLLEAH